MSLTILIVDDAAFMRMMLRSMLEKYGYTVVGEAKNGIEGVAMYKELKPDIVTMDITMPDLDGIGAVKQIKQFDPSAKILMCSAMGQQTMVIDAIRAGAKEFIVKPFAENKIIETIKKLTE